jgi:hypothetical protein
MRGRGVEDPGRYMETVSVISQLLQQNVRSRKCVPSHLLPEFHLTPTCSDPRHRCVKLEMHSR